MDIIWPGSTKEGKWNAIIYGYKVIMPEHVFSYPEHIRLERLTRARDVLGWPNSEHEAQYIASLAGLPSREFNKRFPYKDEDRWLPDLRDV